MFLKTHINQMIGSCVHVDRCLKHIFSGELQNKLNRVLNTQNCLEIEKAPIVTERYANEMSVYSDSLRFIAVNVSCDTNTNVLIIAFSIRMVLFDFDHFDILISFFINH